jgi:hypothetical protein
MKRDLSTLKKGFTPAVRRKKFRRLIRCSFSMIYRRSIKRIRELKKM